MPARRHSTNARWTVLRRLLAALAVVAQVAVGLSAIGEGREGVGAAPHVEARGSGPGHHYSHNESRCAACQARSVHSTAPAIPSAAWEVVVDHDARASVSAQRPLSPALPTNSARAPPQVS